MRRFEQVAAGVRVGERSDAKTVRGVQLAEQELAAGIPHPVELQQTGSWEQCLEGGPIWDEMHRMCILPRLKRRYFLTYLNITLPDHDLRRVSILDQLLQSLRVDVMEGHMGLPTL